MKQRMKQSVPWGSGVLKIWALSLAFLLSGCSLAELGYNNAPALAHTWLVNQIDLYDEQSEQLEQELEGLLAWHRLNELPRIKKQLRLIQQRAQSIHHVTPDEIQALSLEFRESLYRTAREGTPRLAAILVKLWPNQVVQVRSALDTRNAEYREDQLLLSDALVREKARERMVSRFETWLGDLNAVQLQRIEQWSQTHSSTQETRYERRLTSQTRFIEWVDLAANRGVSEAALSQALTDWLAQEQGKVLPTLQSYRDQTTRLVVDVLRKSTPEQRQHLAEFAAEWLEILDELMEV